MTLVSLQIPSSRLVLKTPSFISLTHGFDFCFCLPLFLPISSLFMNENVLLFVSIHSITELQIKSIANRLLRMPKVKVFYCFAYLHIWE